LRFGRERAARRKPDSRIGFSGGIVASKGTEGNTVAASGIAAHASWD